MAVIRFQKTLFLSKNGYFASKTHSKDLKTHRQVKIGILKRFDRSCILMLSSNSCHFSMAMCRRFVTTATAAKEKNRQPHKSKSSSERTLTSEIEKSPHRDRK